MEFTAQNAEALYTALFLPRAVEERMLIALRQGRISKWFSSYGQEAVSVGTALAMDTDEWICTMHRNLGVFTSRDIPLQKLLPSFRAKKRVLPRVGIVRSTLAARSTRFLG